MIGFTTTANDKSLSNCKLFLSLEYTNETFPQNQQTTVVLKIIRLKNSFMKIWNSTCANIIYNSDPGRRLADTKQKDTKC